MVTSRKRAPRPGFTLLEVIVGMILMATLVVGSLTALSRYRSSLAQAARKRQAIMIADDLMNTWVRTSFPRTASGIASIDGSIRWQTRVISQRLLCGVPSEIVRLEVWETRARQTPSEAGDQITPTFWPLLTTCDVPTQLEGVFDSMLTRYFPVPRRAFTLIEMLVAMVLSALLLVVLLSVSRQTLKLRESAVQISQQVQGTELLGDQIERDFAQAERLAVLPDGVVLQGAIALGDSGLIANHQPALVRYRVALLPSGDTNPQQPVPWLFREQISRNGTRSTREPIWRGVGKMVVTSDTIAALSDESEADILLGDDSPAPVDSMPESVRVEMIDANGNLFFARTVYHHWED